MHGQAVESIRKKVYGFLYGCNLNNMFMYDPEDWKLLAKVADYSLQKCDVAMEKVDVMMAIMSLMSISISASDDAKAKARNVPYLLREVVNVDELADAIIHFFTSLPYCYNVYFELPSAKVGVEFCAHIADGVELLNVSRDLVRGVSRTGLPDENILCIRISLSGFISSVSSISFDKAVKIIKALLERAIAAGVLQIPMWTSRSSSAGGALVHKLSEGKTIQSREVIELPYDVSSMLNKLELGQGLKRIELSEAIETSVSEAMIGFRTIFSGSNAVYDNLLAACEWGFDAMAETSNPMKAVKICIGLESIYGERNEEGGITRSLVDRCSFSLAKTAEQRASIATKCRHLYSLRSKVVHGVARSLTSDEVLTLDFGLNVLKDSIEKEIAMITVY